MSHPTSITAAVFEKILAFLAPLFLIVGTNAIATAREVAHATLASYGARTDRELRFAALSIAFSFGALEALSKAADPGLAMNQMLRLTGNANALNRAAHQNETRLEKLLKQPPATTESEDAITATLVAPDVALPSSSAIDELVVFARSGLNATTTPPPVPVTVAALSRQQRRAAEQKAEKVRQRQVQEARLAQRAVQRAAMVPESAMQSA